LDDFCGCCTNYALANKVSIIHTIHQGIANQDKTTALVASFTHHKTKQEYDINHFAKKGAHFEKHQNPEMIPS